MWENERRAKCQTEQVPKIRVKSLKGQLLEAWNEKSSRTDDNVFHTLSRLRPFDFSTWEKTGRAKVNRTKSYVPSFQTEFLENGANNRPRSCRTGSKIDKLDTRIDALIRLGHFHFPGYAKCTRNVLRLCMVRFPISIQTPTCNVFWIPFFGINHCSYTERKQNYFKERGKPIWKRKTEENILFAASHV